MRAGIWPAAALQAARPRSHATAPSLGQAKPEVPPSLKLSNINLIDDFLRPPATEGEN